MAETKNSDPYRSFGYQLQIAGQTVAAFSQVSLPGSSEEMDNRPGLNPPNERVLSGLTEYDVIILNRGITHSTELYDWSQSVQESGATASQKNLKLVLLNEEGNQSLAWNIWNAWPLKYQTSGFDAAGKGTLIFILELQTEGLQRLS